MEQLRFNEETKDALFKNCWDCKHSIDEGQVWCSQEYPNHIIVVNPYYGCENYKEAEG